MDGATKLDILKRAALEYPNSETLALALEEDTAWSGYTRALSNHMHGESRREKWAGSALPGPGYSRGETIPKAPQFDLQPR